MHYYNENDPRMAAWLRELIKAGLIAQGEVDERSIVDVRGRDLAGFVQCHFFAGIGGWPYALKLASWPDDKRAWTGSCPCQPFSCAGKGKGESDERHLWPVFRDRIEESGPLVIFGEQVASKAGRFWLAGVQTDLEGMGFAVGAADLCSASVGAPNIRQRLYWVAESQRAERRPHSTRDEHNRSNAGRDEAASGSGACSESCGLAESSQQQFNGQVRSRGRRARSSDRSGSGWMVNPDERGRGEGAGQRSETQPSTSSWMGSPIQPGLEGHSGHSGNGDNGNEPGRQPENEAGSIAASGNFGFWGEFLWHQCKDGKRRRIPIEPAFFPLAARLPGRVAALRGYGNAINPRIAAEFIKAYASIT